MFLLGVAIAALLLAGGNSQDLQLALQRGTLAATLFWLRIGYDDATRMKVDASFRSPAQYAINPKIAFSAHTTYCHRIPTIAT